jgi:Fe-S cluster biosynthesis and repair protein YggX
MPITCQRCGASGEPPGGHRVVLPEPEKARVLGSVCASCWEQWEGLEVKIINEYRLSFFDPQHRQELQKSCIDFLFGSGGPKTPA